MCDCINKIKADIQKDCYDDEDVVFVSAQEMSTMIYNNRKMTVTSTRVTIGKRFRDDAKIKKQKFSLVHIYCPFCGVKYEN